MSARIALVEDSDEVRRFATMLLTRKGFTVQDYPDGAAALEEILDEPPALVISDVQMPRVDGLQLTRRLRERYSKSELPVVLVSVMSEEEDIVRGFEAGANDYLVKPYRTTELLAKVSILLKEGPFLRRKDEPELPVAAPSPKVPFGNDDSTSADTRETDIREFRPGEEEDTRPLGTEDQATRYYFDKYEIIGEFGRGGMGTVYRAVKRDDGREVALKVLAPRLSENRTSIARFLREIKLLSEVDSEHIVEVYDHGYDGGRYFMAMEAVRGESLDQIVVKSGPLDVSRALRVFRQVAAALVALTDRNLIHRDVKPANVLVDEEDHVKLVDFGLAKQQSDDLSLSESGYALGTPYYIAPEVIEGGSASHLSDLFALGVSMYEVLTGKRPFPGVVAYQIFRLIVSGDHPDPRQHRHDLPDDVAELVMKLLERDRSKRFQSSAELLTAIDVCLSARAGA